MDKEEFYAFHDTITLATLERSLEDCKVEKKRIKKLKKNLQEDEKLPFHEIQNWYDNETHIYCLKNLIRYYSYPSEHGNSI